MATFLAASLVSIHPSAGGFADVDTDPMVVRLCGEDRLSKAVIAKQTGPAKELQDTVLSLAIEEVNRANTLSLICDDLAKGDVRLRDTLIRMLAYFNFSGADAAATVVRWARNGPDRALTALFDGIADRPDMRNAAAKYLMDADAQYIKAYYALDRMLRNEAERSALREAILSSSDLPSQTLDGLLESAAGGDEEARWSLVPAMLDVVESGSAVGRAISGMPRVKGSWYEQVWDRNTRTISEDPALVETILREAWGISVLRDVLVELLRSVIAKKSEYLAQGMVIGGRDIHGKFGRAVAQLLPRESYLDMYERRGGAVKEEGSEPLSGRIEMAVATDEWIDWFMWFLTRPAEAVAQATRSGMKESLTRDSELATTMVARAPLFGRAFEAGVVRGGGYSEIEGGGGALRAAAAEGTANIPALQKYMEAAMDTLATNDAAWDDAVKASEDRPNGVFVKLVTETILRDPTAAAAWVLTVARNDGALNMGFTQWLHDRGRFVDRKAAREWLDGVAQYVSRNSSIGNEETNRFKEWFTEYLQTDDGWEKARTRLLLEGFGFPGVIRNGLIQASAMEPKKLWDIYRLSVYADDALGRIMRERVSDYLLSGGLNEKLLYEVGSRNSRAANAVSPIWPLMFSPKSIGEKSMVDEMESGVMASSFYALGVSVALDVMESHSDWAGEIGVSRSDLLVDEPAKKTEAIGRLLGDARFREAWRQRMVNMAVYFGSADVVAMFIRSRPELLVVWNDLLTEILRDDPQAMSSAVMAASARVGGMVARTSLIEGVAATIFGDRVFFEQLLTDPNKSFRAAIMAAIQANMPGYKPDFGQEKSIR